MTREEAKHIFRTDKDSYGKPKAIMSKIDQIYNDFEREQKNIQLIEKRFSKENKIIRSAKCTRKEGCIKSDADKVVYNCAYEDCEFFDPNKKVEEKEYILCAAIHFDDGIEGRITHCNNIKTGIVICGHRHHNIFGVLNHLKLDRLRYKKQIQGFITNKNRFVNRVEALEIALAANQTIKEKLEFNQLYSEDLY